MKQISSLTKRFEFKIGNGYIKIPIGLWIIVSIVFLSLLLLHTFNDILITAKQSNNFWTLLFEGRPLDFYKEAVMTTGSEYYPTVQHASYLFPIYLVFAIWNLPTWLIERITGESLINSIPSMIWMKLMLVPFIILSMKSFFGILNDFGKTKTYAKLGCFLFASSVVVFYSIGLMGQYDIVTIPFVLMGYRGWLNNDKKRFLLCFSIAVTFKYFALLFFIPLLLLEEKRIHRIIAKSLIAIMPSVVFLFLFPRASGQKSMTVSYFSKFLWGIETSDGSRISLFPIVVIIVLIVCFIKKLDEQDKLFYSSFYISIIMGCFCLPPGVHPQWCLYAMPIILTCSLSSNNINKSIILESIFAIVLAIKNYTIYSWVFGCKSTGAMRLLYLVFGKPLPDPNANISVLAVFDGRNSVYGLIYTALIVLFVSFIWFSRPKGQKYVLLEPLNMGTVYLRTAFNLLVALLPTVYIIASLFLR